MRPPKCTPALIEKVCECLRNGDSQGVACKKAGIIPQTLCRWKTERREVAEAIENARNEFLTKISTQLEASLWKRAMGYDVTETETVYEPLPDGSPTIKRQTKKQRHIPGDTQALIFALSNVAPDRWAYKRRIEAVTREKEEAASTYHFEDLPDDVLFKLADELQDAQMKRNGKEAGGESE